jgi:hypothetical protein
MNESVIYSAFAAPAPHETGEFGPGAGPPQAGPRAMCMRLDAACIAVP